MGARARPAAPAPGPGAAAGSIAAACITFETDPRATDAGRGSADRGRGRGDDDPERASLLIDVDRRHRGPDVNLLDTPGQGVDPGDRAVTAVGHPYGIESESGVRRLRTHPVPIHL